MAEEVIQGNKSEIFCCRWSQSLGDLECGHSATKIWRTKDYDLVLDRYKPTVFWGLYDLRDY